VVEVVGKPAFGAGRPRHAVTVAFGNGGPDVLRSAFLTANLVELAMTVVVAPDRPGAPRPGIFLAGGISGVGDWQREAIAHLRPVWPTVYNPRRANFPIGDEAAGAEQIRWEFDHLALADVVLFWFSFETIQPIVLYELGRWAASAKPLAVGADPRYERRFDVVQQLGLARPGLTVHADLESTCAAANLLVSDQK